MMPAHVGKIHNLSSHCVRYISLKHKRKKVNKLEKYRVLSVFIEGRSCLIGRIRDFVVEALLSKLGLHILPHVEKL